MFRVPIASVLPLACAALLSLGACSGEPAPMRIAGGEPQLGRELIQRYGCVACHAIPGLSSYGANVGPPLHRMGERAYVAGVVANTPDNLVAWLQDPAAIDPRTAMPRLGISEREARHIAAYLVTAH